MSVAILFHFLVSALQAEAHLCYSNQTAPNLQHTTNREQNDDVVIQQHSRKLLMMDILNVRNMLST